MKYNPEKHHRRSMRLKGYDYSSKGLYFITICCKNRNHLFGEIIDGKMNLNIYGELAYDEWKNTTNIRDNIHLHEFIIMPDHMHGIIEILNRKGAKPIELGKFKSPSQTIGSIIRGFKIATIKKIKEKIIHLDKSQSAQIKPSHEDTGELPFAPMKSPLEDTGELPFAPSGKIIKLNFKIWQRNYYEHIIRNKKAFENISKYIRNNPLKWQKDNSSH